MALVKALLELNRFKTEGEPPFDVVAELWYQPIASRWAENLRPYAAPEPRRFVSYFDGLASSSSAMLTRDSSTVQ